ncbi:SapC family protein [Alteromonas oceanisediminis]|uniref:SapC family protein n=1 Tax=Alteromonas oceanisediminis TaxID=2836180 RepID=UPI001BD9E461|nr:SapC family protein [Alteromonas oceanisediminis]MBT0585515.1 SapC family protein [Alteromonas oceanisediminis]
MAINYVPLDKNKHKELKVSAQAGFEFAKGSHLAAATIREFAQLAGSMPIVFIKDPQSGNYHVVAMLGTEQNTNFYVVDGKWQGPYVPMNIQRYPFDVRPDGDKLGVFFDENSDVVGDTGEALFTEDGEATEFLNKRQQFLSELANSEMLTQRFVKKVVELDLLEEIQVQLTYENGQQRNVTGMQSINEKKLRELDDAQVLEMHKNGFLGAIYATMVSLGQLNRLIELSNKTDMPIRNLQIRAAADAAKASQAQPTQAPQA